MLLSQLAVVFVGLAGNHHETVERQLSPVLEHAGVTELAIPDGDVGAIVRHDEHSRAIVRALHVDGLIGGALIKDKGVVNFRLVIFDGDGNLRSLGETPLTKGKLSKGDIEVFGMNLDDEIESMAKRHGGAKPEAAKPAPEPPKPIAVAMNTPRATATPAPSHALAEITFDDQPKGLGPAPAKRNAPAAPAAPHDDDDAPPGLAPTKHVAAPPKHDEPPPPPPKRAAQQTDDTPAAEHHDAAPVETAAVSLDEIEAATSGEAVDTGSATVVASGGLHMHAGLTLGLAGRVFAPGSPAITGYSSNPVGAAGFEVGVSPTARTSLVASAERTIQMSSAVADGMASTAMSRWQVGGSYALTRGEIEIAPTAGIGHRSFSIDSTDPSRSPDGDYTYLVLGATVAKPLGANMTLRGLAAFEPVVGGVEPTEMAFGDASRWALDVGAALELHLHAHVFARATVEYQRFSLSWDAAGARGAGGATDSYPSGTVSFGADY